MPESPSPSSDDLIVEKADPGADFLINEFNSLREFVQRSEDAISRNTDVLLALVSALGAAFAFLLQSSINKDSLLLVAVYIALPVLIISFMTFHSIVSRDIQSTNYIRSMNLIRSYFVSHYPAIKYYLALPSDVRYPKYGKRSRGRETVAIINCFLFSSSLILVTDLIRQTENLDVQTTIIGILSFVVGVLVQFVYAIVLYRRAAYRSEKAILEREQQAAVEETDKVNYGGIYPSLRGPRRKKISS